MDLHSISFFGLERFIKDEVPEIMSDKDYTNYYWTICF